MIPDRWKKASVTMTMTITSNLMQYIGLLGKKEIYCKAYVCFSFRYVDPYKFQCSHFYSPFIAAICK